MIWFALYEVCCIWFMMDWMQRHDEKVDSIRFFIIIVLTAWLLPLFVVGSILGKLIKRNNP